MTEMFYYLLIVYRRCYNINSIFYALERPPRKAHWLSRKCNAIGQVPSRKCGYLSSVIYALKKMADQNVWVYMRKIYTQYTYMTVLIVICTLLQLFAGNICD